MAKYLSGYGVRVQKSAFEAWLKPQEYKRMLEKLPGLIDEENDYLRVYRLSGYSEIKIWGTIGPSDDKDFVII